MLRHCSGCGKDLHTYRGDGPNLCASCLERQRFGGGSGPLPPPLTIANTTSKEVSVVIRPRFPAAVPQPEPRRLTPWWERPIGPENGSQQHPFAVLVCGICRSKSVRVQFDPEVVIKRRAKEILAEQHGWSLMPDGALGERTGLRRWSCPACSRPVDVSRYPWGAVPAEVAEAGGEANGEASTLGHAGAEGLDG